MCKGSKAENMHPLEGISKDRHIMKNSVAKAGWGQILEGLECQPTELGNKTSATTQGEEQELMSHLKQSGKIKEDRDKTCKITVSKTADMKSGNEKQWSVELKKQTT